MNPRKKKKWLWVLINPPVFERIKNQNKHFAKHLDGAAKA